jgi:competence protein ComEA
LRGGVRSVDWVTSPSKPQIAIYAALVVAVLLIGARFMKSGSGAPPVALPPSTIASDAAPDGASAAPAAGGRLVVDVKGAVRQPGVYRLADGSRVLDAVHRAGGLTHRADRIGVNLAARVVDGGEVVVPERGGSADVPAGAAAPTDAPLAIDLNSATETELEQLDGVGPATAAKIVAYREQNGGIASIDELDEVSGIGEAKLAAIHAQLGR